MARADGTTLRFDVFHLPPGVDLLYRDADVMPLEPRAVRVLRYLVEHHDRVLSKEELLEEVWTDVFTTDGVLKKAVSQIRRVLGDDADRSRFIATYHGRGYRFIAPVKRAAAPPTVTTPAPDLIPNYDQLAGRAAEMLTLRAELRSALEGNPRPVVISGEAGVGKTQLVRHFRRWTLEQGAVSLYGRFFEYRGARLAPYQIFIDLLRNAVGEEHGTPLRDRIESLCDVRLPAELFADSERTSTAGAAALGDHYRFVVPLCRCWLALSRQQPVVVVLDDLQWADAASLDLIGCLMRSLDTEPLMLIMLMRSGDPKSRGDLVHAWLEEHAAGRAYTTLHLEPLDEADCREVIGAIFGTRRSGEIPRGDVEKLFALTDGNPYFLVETLRLLVAAGAVEPDPSKRRWLWKGIGDVALPETIVTAARSKVERLPAAVGALIEQAAIVGEEFRLPTLCALTDEDEETIEALLSEALRAGVLTTHGLTPGEDCRFQHSILRQVVYDEIAPHRRRALHARAAAAIESVYAGDRDRVAEALASHYWAAGDARRSFEAGMHAWRAASGRSEWRKALAIIERADEAMRALEDGDERADELEEMDLLTALAETLCAVGQSRDAQPVIDRAIALAMSASDRRSLGRAMFVRGVIEIALSNYSGARGSLTRALELFVHNKDARSVSHAIVQLAVVEAAVGNYDRARSLVAQLRQQSQSDEVVALADGILGWSLALRGRYAEGATLLEQALEHYDRAGDVRERALLLRRLHWTHLSRGNYEEAIRLAVRARSDYAMVGDVNGEAKANMGIGQARLAQGLHAEAMSFLRRAIEQLKTIGDAHCEAECRWLLGRAHHETGREEEAYSLLDRALRMIREIGDRDDEFRVLIDLARLHVTRAELRDAQSCALLARGIAESLGNREGSALATLELARVDLASGNAAKAVETARRVTAVLEELQSSERWRAWSVLGLLESVAGELEPARVSLGRAVALLDAIRQQIDPADVARHEIIAQNSAVPTEALRILSESV